MFGDLGSSNFRLVAVQENLSTPLNIVNQSEERYTLDSILIGDEKTHKNDR